MNKKSIFIYINVFMAVFLLQVVSPVFAEEVIIVKVDGMFCPFCTYGVEKKLKALKGVAKVQIHLRRGEAELHVKPGATVTDAVINQAVDDAGFSPGTITRPTGKRGK